MIGSLFWGLFKSGDVHPLIHTDRESAFPSKEVNSLMTNHQVTKSRVTLQQRPIERLWNAFKQN
ncbi:hypothetical protein FD30_GL000742 [Levilactobacillus namurensis DSM 19117]|uniref:Integrase catalytic domain-containing protein n=1 Tax=Levilactobacillus namurensis DSM 19117 TaxID=1423773 RepID=A0A0R1K919_9LACO|nr:hypothetical protein FD30_GL000742 [Levilactobacillus namurensis DSM 19117]